MPKPSLIAARVSEEVRPCDDCKNYNRCAKESLSCGDFRFWLDSGECVNENRRPTRSKFDRLYPGHLVKN